MDPTKKRKVDENGLSSTEFADPSSRLDPQDARKLIDLLNHEQLMEILQGAVARHMDVLDAVRLIADRDPAQRKLFVRGLGWDTTSDSLRTIFSSYGELEEAVVITDKTTGKSKGYGFVTCKHVDGALLALKEPSKKIDGRMTVTQLATPGAAGGNPSLPNPVDVSLRKIYVANVPFDMPADRLLAHFSTYGEVEEGPVGFDKQTGKSRGFALFVYKTAEAAQNSLLEPTKTIDGRQMMCKLANDGKKNKPAQTGPGGAQSGTDAYGDGFGMPPSSMAASIGSQYGAPGSMSSYGSFSGGLPTGHLHHLNSSLRSTGLSSIGSQPPSSMGFGSGYGGFGGGAVPYAGSSFAGPGSAVYGGSALGANTGSGLGGAGGGSSMYGRFPPSSMSMPTAGGFTETAHYALSGSSAFPSQHHQPAGASPAPRVPPGGMYGSGTPYY